jgi:cytosine/adenosine deaminase-related metal-dependent hydrolase
MLKIATMGSARLLGRDKEIGSVEVGKCADFFMVDSGRLELTGACFDPKSVFGTVGLRGAVDYTVIDGEVTVEHGVMTGVDEEKLVAESDRELRRCLASM